MEEALRLKSELMQDGTLLVPEGFDHPYADPKGDGTGTIIAEFEGTRFRMRYSPEKGRFALVERDGGYGLDLDGHPFIGRIGFVKAYCHSPYQANVSLGKFSSDEEILSYLDKIVTTGTVKGIPVSGENPVGEMASIIGKIHSRYPRIPIGLSYVPVSRSDLILLKDSGLSEFKIAIGSTIGRIHAVLDPETDVSAALDCLEEAVGIFGKGKVCTGISVGMGETDQEVEDMFELISGKGILTDLKLKKIGPKNRERFESSLGKIPPMTSERLAGLAEMLKSSQERHGLDPSTMDTLCLACRCCNLVPIRDF